MIRALFNIMGFTAPKVETQIWANESFEELNYKLNDNIEVLSKYVGALGEDYRGTYLDAEISRFSMDEDLVLLSIAYSKGHADVPRGFSEVIRVEHKCHPNILVCSKKHKDGDPHYFRVFKTCENFFVTALTLRGADVVIDAAGRIDTECGDMGDACTPRVKTAQEGCLVSMFAYGDPHRVRIKDQINLVSLANDGKGFALGISPTHGGTSKRIRASSEESHKGNGNDIALAISFY